MKSFLITFKPARENPERGWPLEKLQQLVKRHRAGELVEEDWRFINRKDASLGDRVFLLLQGKGGPAIIGYGKISGAPKFMDDQWYTPVQFESLVDPEKETLGTKEELLGMDARAWKTQASGVMLEGEIAKQLEELVVGAAARPKNTQASNPDWTRDELILALNLYLKHRPNPPGKNGKEIQDLSNTLNRLGDKLFPPESRAETFRNTDGVSMKLQNFRRLDPQYTAGGKKGLPRGAKADEEVWAEFSNDPVRCRRVAEAIMATLDDPEVSRTGPDPATEGISEAMEGRLLTRKHLARERNRKLVEAKRKQALKTTGRLACEACGFEFGKQYGERGRGFIECHHTKPLAALAEETRTHINDLALVCSNCHRMIHRRKTWLTVAEVKELLVAASPAAPGNRA
jgi:5-methylcytosine-specific restriction protein A